MHTAQQFDTTNRYNESMCTSWRSLSSSAEQIVAAAPASTEPPAVAGWRTPVEVGPASAGPAAGSRCLDPHHDFEIGPWPPIICFAAAGAQGGRRWVLCRVSRRRLAYCSHGPYLYSLEVLECITAAGNGPVPWRWGLFATRRPSKVRQLDCSEEPALRDSDPPEL